MYEYSADETAPVRGASQEVAHTASRHSGPRAWLRAVEWLIAAGLHRRANATTLQIARDLGARMDYSTGHVRYCLDEIVARTGISKATVKRHVAYLRDLGALAWVQHGTRANIRRALGLGGYAATATVYAAVIPAVYDHAMGHQIVGTGYDARIVVDYRMPDTRPAATPTAPVDNASSEPVDNSPERSCEPPSLTSASEEGKVQMVGGKNYTSQAQPTKPRIPHQSTQINGRRRTAADVEKASKTTRLVRAMVSWTQSVPLRRLEHVLRPWTDRGLDAYQITADLHGMCTGLTWKPARPDAFIAARAAANAEREKQLVAAQEAAARWEHENCTVGAFQSSTTQHHDVMAGLRQGLTSYQQAARTNGWDDLSHGETVTWDAEADMAAFLGSPA
ncbi:hypothetical protein [Streptomyces sp. NPDC047985]|uniref:hypothetical protein n=1 Tax=Streptomyces sp. NPDC047985 TaxID=3155384 RepID=UPI00343907F6